MTKNGESRLPSTLVLMAALNEEEGIGLTLSELSRYLRNYRVVVIDGNSKDQTVHVAKSHGADVIYQEGKGKGDALDCAIRQFITPFDYVALTDADYTYPAEYLPHMLEILEDNPDVGMVCGNRFNSHLQLDAMRNMFYFGNRVLAFAHNMLNGVNMRDPLTGLRAIRWELFEDFKPKSDGFDIEVELNHYIASRGFGIAEIEVPYRARLGEKKLKLKHGFTIISRILSESMF